VRRSREEPPLPRVFGVAVAGRPPGRRALYQQLPATDVEYVSALGGVSEATATVCGGRVRVRLYPCGLASITPLR
jgi:hypothetical protein